jgi:hypothetical protein
MRGPGPVPGAALARPPKSPQLSVGAWLSVDPVQNGSRRSETVSRREPISISTPRFVSQVRVTIDGQTKRRRWFDSRRLHYFFTYDINCLGTNFRTCPTSIAIFLNG